MYVLPEVFIVDVISFGISDGSLRYLECDFQSQFSSEEDTAICHLPACGWWTCTIYSRRRKREREREGEDGWIVDKYTAAVKTTSLPYAREVLEHACMYTLSSPSQNEYHAQSQALHRKKYHA